jgi:hypothetical protein
MKLLFNEVDELYSNRLIGMGNDSKQAHLDFGDDG